MSTDQPTRPATDRVTDRVADRATTDLVDTRDMVTVHRFLRREFRLLPAAVERVADGDVARAAEVAGHVEFLTDVLHHHHTAEDDYLWPLLLERVPDELAPLVELMESQHHRVDELLQVIGAAVPQWRASAAIAERELLATLLIELSAALDEHMEAEEDHVLPIAARTVTVAEWEHLGEQATAQQDRKMMPLLLGLIRYEGDPAVVAEMLAKAPRLVRLLAPRLATRAFARYAQSLHGTATPPRVGTRG